MRKSYPDRTREARAERLESVRELTRLGYSSREIAERLGIDRINVIRARKHLGIAQTPAPRLTAEQITMAADLLVGGASVAETARSVGCSWWSINRHLPGHSWTHAQRTEYTTMRAKYLPEQAEHHNVWWGKQASRLVTK